MKAMLEPRMVAARIQGAAVVAGWSQGVESMVASSQGGLAMVAMIHSLMGADLTRLRCPWMPQLGDDGKRGELNPTLPSTDSAGISPPRRGGFGTAPLDCPDRSKRGGQVVPARRAFHAGEFCARQSKRRRQRNVRL